MNLIFEILIPLFSNVLVVCEEKIRPQNFVKRWCFVGDILLFSFSYVNPFYGRTHTHTHINTNNTQTYRKARLRCNTPWFIYMKGGCSPPPSRFNCTSCQFHFPHMNLENPSFFLKTPSMRFWIESTYRTIIPKSCFIGRIRLFKHFRTKSFVCYPSS